MTQPNFTQLLQGLDPGDPQAGKTLLPMVYAELREVAAAKLAAEAPGHTLQPTALVHEAWLRLGGDPDHQWNGRAHFVAAAAEAMRRILIDRARSRKRIRHGGDLKRVDLDSVDLAATTDDDTLLRMNDALERLALHAPEKAQLVKLRFFTGLSVDQAAAALGVGRETAKRHWAYARAWLYLELKNFSG